MPHLHVICPDGHAYDVQLVKEKLSIGRGKDNDIMLADSTVSRSHASITKVKEGFLITDHGSFNGTHINQQSVQSVLLRDGDQIEIGLTKMIFWMDEADKKLPAGSVIIAPEADYETGQQHVVESSPQSMLGCSGDLLIAAKSARSSPAAQSSAADGSRGADLQSLERANKVLFVLYEISRQLNALRDFNKLLQKIMDLIFMVIDADHGFIILKGSEGGDELLPVIVKHRDELTRISGQLTASRTIINRVMHDRVALLTSNAMADSRLDNAQSVFVQQIRSAMCVPLWKNESIIGVIQLDSAQLGNQFTADDLELLKAIGSQVAMVIEQASLNEKIREEEQMRRRLERFHSPQVVEMILGGGQETKDNIMDPKEVTASILFTDIIGFTRLAEQMPAREINMILNHYFSRMTDIVFRYDGTLDKYIGDGLMAVFGAPMAKADDARRAIQAALDMRNELVGLRKELGGKASINIRIGINTGRVVAGNMGSPKRLEYTVIGDAVNIAARLESIAQPNQILIGQETWRLVRDCFTVREIGPRLVKGKSAEIMVYEVA